MRFTNRLAMTVAICAILALGISITPSPMPGILDAYAQSSDEISMTDILDAILDDGTSTSGDSSDLDPVAQAAQTYFSTDFEINTNGFTFGGNGLWHRSVACATATAGAGHTTTGALGASDELVAPGTCEYIAVTNVTDTADSPSIDLTAVSVPIVLTFNYFLDTDGSIADFARVQYSIDAGANYTTVADNAASPVPLIDDATWRTLAITLPVNAAGASVILRFEFEVDAVTNPGEGFFVDDVVVTGDDGAAAGSGNPGAGPCFIATAAYGTPLAEDIGALRAVRDTYLLNNVFGAAFVDTYYRTSPVVADWVSRYPVVASGVRLALAPVIALSRVALNAPLALSVLLLVTGVAALGIRSRKTASAA
ncbi:MAG: hypothetical protein IID08_05795 [Candidatus Hydrogenedentes bacterium]|nr:hypothetical protein [Candidatus Hydrogenedentota bacterium]